MANFLSRIFGFGKTRSLEANNAPELVELCQFEKHIDALLKRDNYIARSDYKNLIDGSAHLYAKFKVLSDSNTLRYFCRDNSIDSERIIHFLSLYEDLLKAEDSATINAHNEKFLSNHLASEKSYLDGILAEVDRKEYEGKGGKYFLIGKCVEEIMDGLISKYEHPKILLLGRYGFDGYNLTKSADFIYDEKTGSVRSKKYNADYFDFMTVHRAKGLGYDHVIIINARNETYGFPSQVQEDPVLKYVVKDDHSYDYAEERRLFYVALTRTKNRVYIITPQQHPSEFVLELIRDYPQVEVFGEIDKEPQEMKLDKRCPICGYPLQLRYKKAYGLKLWICTNEPEICDFMTNNLAGEEMTIMKCDKCKDGYLIVKDGRGSGPFLGCTNYKADKTGCNNYVTKDFYLRKYKGQN